MLAFVEELQ